MATINYYLKQKDSKEDTLIFMYVSFSGYRLKFSTGEKINPKFWNFTKQRARDTRDFNQSLEFNYKLDQLEALVMTSYRRLKNDNVKNITTDILRNEINKVLKPSESVFFITFIELYIKNCLLKKSEKTILFYTSVKNIIKKYSPTILVEEIDDKYFSDFVTFLLKKNKSTNTIKKYFTALTQFADAANIKIAKKIKLPLEKSDSIYLTMDEINRIYEYDFSYKKLFERVRDVFLIGCFTGLRYSDFSRLTKVNYQTNFIEIKTNKTGADVIIPIHPIVKAIFLKYSDGLPKLTNEQIYDNIKRVCKKVGIDSEFTKTITKGGVKITTVYKKYEKISSHTARRSAATNMYLAGIPSISIMKITGHKTEASFMKYIKISQEENAMKLKDHPFFN